MRYRKSDTPCDREHDIVVVSVIIETGDPGRIWRRGVSERDKGNECRGDQDRGGADDKLTYAMSGPSSGPAKAGTEVIPHGDNRNLLLTTVQGHTQSHGSRLKRARRALP